MMNRRALHAIRLAALALGILASVAHAGKIDIGTGLGDNVVAMLNSESTLFTDAYRIAITDKGLTFSRAGKGILTRATQGTTVARMEYIYTREGREYSRFYYARSGPAMDVTFDRIAHQASGSGGSSSTGESTGSTAYEITEDDIAKDIAEEKFYPRDTARRVRAPNLPNVDRGVVANDTKHAGDAELKIFRKIESDIATRAVTPGGRLVGYVSKAVCSSCENASKLLADQYDIDGNIYQLLEAGSEQPIDAVTIESQKASAALKTRRQTYIKSHLTNRFVPLDRGARIAPPPLDPIEAEETREATAEPCGV